MRKLLLALFLSTFMVNAYAQFPVGGGGQGRQGGQAPSIGHFYGKIVDSKTNKGLDGVSVQLIQNKFDTATKKGKDVAIAGMITESKGNFSLENLPIFGSFRLKITAIGYKPYEVKVQFDMKFGQGGDMSQALNGVDKDLGNIKLESEAQTLSEVTVTASKPLIQLGADRKIYNVEKDISAQGGSGIDVMKNVPSVAVDIDGNVTLRNATPTILVDGLPTTLTLDQIPADAIQSVEIITNPGAKFDASGGTSGILNIILKKNRKAGYNGNVRAGVDQRGKLNLGGDLNMKEGKVNFFVAGNYGQRKSISTGVTDRYSFFSNPFDSLQQYDNNVSTGYFAFGRAGIDYFLDNRNTISVSGTIVHGKFTPYINSNLFVDTLYPSGTVSSFTNRNSNTNAEFNNHGAMLSYKHNFPRSGEELTANANYSKGTNQNDNLITSNIYEYKGGGLTSIYTQQQLGTGDNEFMTAQTDFTNPISDKSKFETGARIAVRNVSSINDIGIIVPPNNTFILEPLLSSQYNYHDRVYAGYVNYTNAVKNFSYQAGLRVEGSTYSGSSNYAVKDNPDTTGSFGNKYPVSLFPSVFLTQKLGGEQEIQLSYTRRIDRPNFFQLFPFTNYSDSLNLTQGNPNLKPQFTNSLELTYQKTFPGNNTFIASVYYKYTTDLITGYSDSSKNPLNDSTVILSTFVNANSSFVGGFEIIGRNSITKWWDITSNINIFTSKINASNVAVPTVGQTYSWFGKINNTFKLNKHVTLQLTGDYTSKTVLPPGGSAGTGSNTSGRGFGVAVSGNAQGYTKPSGGVDAALRYEFLKNKAASLTLSVNDIFRTRIADVYTSSPFFIQEYNRRRDPQFFRLQFNYRFGKFDVSLFKRKNTKADTDSMQNSMQGVQ
ncbi:MAG TPA: outer membrane beta-barrel protein [Puia sp.]|nr:outer membrane beta-barrel protein [Puia sp.]